MSAEHQFNQITRTTCIWKKMLICFVLYFIAEKIDETVIPRLWKRMPLSAFSEFRRWRRWRMRTKATTAIINILFLNFKINRKKWIRRRRGVSMEAKFLFGNNVFIKKILVKCTHIFVWRKKKLWKFGQHLFRVSLNFPAISFKFYLQPLLLLLRLLCTAEPPLPCWVAWPACLPACFLGISLFVRHLFGCSFFPQKNGRREEKKKK